MTRFSDVDLSSLSTTASPLSAMVPASSLVAQSENFFSSIFLPLLLKVKTFSLFYFSSHALYSRWGCLSFFLLTGGVIVVLEPSTALATLVLTTGGTK